MKNSNKCYNGFKEKSKIKINKNNKDVMMSEVNQIGKVHSIKTTIISFSIIPVVILGIMIIVLFNRMLSESTDKDVISNLKGSALTVLTAYNQNPGDYITGAGGGLWKGNFNVGDSKKMITSIGEASNIDIFFYSKDECIVSTLENVNETNMSLPKDIAKVVMEDKFDFISTNYNVNGVPSYVYGITVFQERSNEDVVGMIVVTGDIASRKVSMNSIIQVVEIVLAIVVVVVVILGIIIVNAFTAAIFESIKNIELVSTGQLSVNIKEKFINRKDELGIMNKSLAKLIKELRGMILHSIEESSKLQESAIKLDSTAQKTNDSIETVNNVVNAMTEASDVQFKTSEKLSTSVEILGDLLDKTYGEIIKLDTTKIGMQYEGRNIQKIVSELIYINDALNKVIGLVNSQIEKTYLTAKNIKEHADQIAAFADETNLLSMNASIEAVRVGEEGKGFAIVAKQIKELADQSTVVSGNITDEIKDLLDGSNKTINRMEEVNKVVERMNYSIEVTEDVFNKINSSINVMSGNVEEIKGKIKIMEDANDQIIDVIDDLKAVSQKNNSLVSDTSEVTEYMSELFDEATAIKSVSKKLVDSIQVFKL